MTDNFLLLDEPRRPWLDADALKRKFLARSAEVHPDRTHNAAESEKLAANQRYTALNAAYNCLREPKDRVRNLLELELGQKPSDLTSVPDHPPMNTPASTPTPAAISIAGNSAVPEFRSASPTRPA